MAFDNQTRSRLQRMVTQCRQILAEEFTSQLQGTYGIQPDGSITNLKDMSHLDDDERVTAGLLRERIKHIESGPAASKNLMKEAVVRLVREQSFTILNRFAAKRMAEERGIILESIANGMNSRGFKVYEKTSGRALGTAYERYRTFVYCIWDELSIDLGALFDRFSPYGLLFPREKSLEKLFEILNDREIAHLWKEDETIGWIYQYFNSKEEREAMRRASQAPRNSRELAVRNQFFTPRYVVEFLTDNTLGRIWYEMTRGNTRLKEVCRYMVRRPNEIFLDKDEEPPERKSEEQEKSGEELLKEPVYIPLRRIKDPREILMLDPACGSMHFGLYAFDLYEAIYEEAWDNYPGLLSDLRQKVSGKEEFLRLVPELIIRFNIHGIDIDHRAVQIANLSLWLRAQKSWKKQELKSNQRPTITRSNVVCAEPMPGEKQFLEEFTASLQPPILGKLVEVIWEKMQLAGEAGALLKIEEEISSAIEEAKREWTEIKAPFFQKPLFKEFEMSMQKEFKFPVYDVEEDFWQEAEKRVIDALKEFSEKAVSGQSYQRQMFSEEVVQGFSFIDICRKKYDVVLMNPPFGESATSASSYIEKEYVTWNKNLLCSFIDGGWLKLNQYGALGAIYDRTAIVKSTYEDFRRKVLLESSRLAGLADLGWEILDGAFVEITSCFLHKSNIDTAVFFDVRNVSMEIKSIILKQAIETFSEGSINDYFTIDYSSTFFRMPNASLSYDMPLFIRKLFINLPPLYMAGAKANPGIQIKMDIFGRLRHEVNPVLLRNRTFVDMYNGSSFCRFYTPIQESLLWLGNGEHLKFHHSTRWNNEHRYFLPGIGYGKRGDVLDAHILPKNVIFTIEGLAVFPKDISSAWYFLGVLNSPLASLIINYYCGQHKHAGYVDLLPVPIWDKKDQIHQKISSLSREIYQTKRDIDKYNEVSPFFYFPWGGGSGETISGETNKLILLKHKVEEKSKELEDDIEEAYSISRTNKESIKNFISTFTVDTLIPVGYDDEKFNRQHMISNSLLLYIIGLSFGRWDIRIAMDSSLAPELSGPFEPLPVCPPGMLVGTDGLPAKPGGIVSEEWLRARPNAITLPPDNSVKNPTITDDKYPLRISRDGILVDDSTAVSGQSHQEDIVHRVREVLNLLWKHKAFEIEQEICDFLKIKDLETYFQKPSGFFQDHLKRYSKSRRQAPIYWPLSTASGSYTLWIYYHRLDDQTLYKCVNDFIEPKIREKERMIHKKRAEMGEAADLLQKQELEKDMSFLQELNDLKNELIRIAELPYKPNLNDGVLITAAPLYNLFRLPKWKKDLKTCWEKLENGEYDWAHLALAIWPQRVKEKCKTDKSLAIAHELESLYQEPESPKKKSNRQR